MQKKLRRIRIACEGREGNEKFAPQSKMAEMLTFCEGEKDKENSGSVGVEHQNKDQSRKLTDSEKVELLNQFNKRPCWTRKL